MLTSSLPERSPSIASNSSNGSSSGSASVLSSTTATTNPACSTISGPLVRRALLTRTYKSTNNRRRLAPEQLQALNNLFLQKQNPSREERMLLAMDLGMEPKTVTNWFCSRRSTARKHAAAWAAITPPTGTRNPLQRAVSLDEIAERSTRPSSSSVTKSATTVITPYRPPLTPRRVNVSNRSTGDLWQNMPSSPPLPPSSPAAEKDKLASLSITSRARTRRSLEWACANARVAGSSKEHYSARRKATAYHVEALNQFDTRELGGVYVDYDIAGETEPEDMDEAVTPPFRVTAVPSVAACDAINEAEEERQWESEEHAYKSPDRAEDSLARILLDFKR